MKKNLAVIGYGGQGAWHCTQALGSDVVNLVGTYDIREVRRNAAKDNGIFVYDSNEALLNDPKVEIVVIAIPNDEHLEWVIKALEAGKNVICEKPVSMCVEELDKMIAAANKSGKLFSVHQNRRWDVDFLAMKQISRSGEIGKIINIESRVHGSRGIPSDWRCQKDCGGGMILDWGVHLIDQLLQIFKDEEIDTVYCENTHITNKEVDDGFKLTMRFKSGQRAYVEVGTYNFIALPRFYMQCENGTALITDWREKAKVAKMKAWNEKEVLPVQTAAGITKTMAPRDEITLDEYEIERPLSDVHDYYRNYVAALDGKAESLIKHSEVRRVMKVMEAAFESDRTGAPVKF
ncbi:MAG: Gfo/Idh/MocA family oxidoreductase [Clostridia bacterium]|nr:Gfo/Idh/MocA family oxidoreductase [Clostridia bacterium]